jgi:hypothetical protein
MFIGVYAAYFNLEYQNNASLWKGIHVIKPQCEHQLIIPTMQSFSHPHVTVLLCLPTYPPQLLLDVLSGSVPASTWSKLWSFRWKYACSTFTIYIRGELLKSTRRETRVASFHILSTSRHMIVPSCFPTKRKWPNIWR